MKLKLSSLLTASALAMSMVSPVIMAKNQITEQQKQEFEKIIHEYLINNPEVLLEASQALQQKQQRSIQEQARKVIQEHSKQLLTEELAVMGNPNGNVTVVEFFDYQCIHCKKMKPVISELLKKNEHVRVVYKELPIFGKSSEIASQAVLAAAMQGQYQKMHEALLNQEKRLDEALIMETAKSLGLDMERLKKDMTSDTVTQALEANRKLAESLQLMGTPAFIVMATPKGQLDTSIAPVLIPGAASEETLQELVNKAANKAETNATNEKNTDAVKKK